MKIALALSGGGFRATVFHLGVLARLALDPNNLFPQVTFLSTVSGGSLCAGLVYGLSDFRWPSAEHYLSNVLPGARDLLTKLDFQETLISKTLTQIWTLFRPRTDALSRLMQQQWGLTARLAQIPTEPRWLINACCYETGKNFRFESHRMGDYVFGYAHPGDLRLADALAASAGFPGLIGFLPLKTSRYQWFQYNHKGADELSPKSEPSSDPATRPTDAKFPELHLWDGGAYDNQGLEGLMNFGTGWHRNIDFLIVSEASPKSQPVRYTWGIPALYRLVTGIMMEQVRSLRAQLVIEQLQRHDQLGAYFRIGNTCGYVLRQAGRTADAQELAARCLSAEAVDQAARMPTMIRRLTPLEYDRLFRHGFETADYTLYGYHAEAAARPCQFDFMSYAALEARQSV